MNTVLNKIKKMVENNSYPWLRWVVREVANHISVGEDEVRSCFQLLVKNGILSEEVEYLCSSCNWEYVLDERDVSERLCNGKMYCDHCSRSIDLKSDKTGYVHYRFIDRDKLLTQEL